MLTGTKLYTADKVLVEKYCLSFVIWLPPWPSNVGIKVTAHKSLCVDFGIFFPYPCEIFYQQWKCGLNIWNLSLFLHSCCLSCRFIWTTGFLIFSFSLVLVLFCLLIKVLLKKKLTFSTICCTPPSPNLVTILAS